MRILALDAALARCSAGVVADEVLVAVRLLDGMRGQAAALPQMAADVLAEAGLRTADLDMVAVTIGPGGFTGLRAALALAHGIALATGRPVAGVTVGEALADSLPGLRRPLWVAVDSRRGQVFLDRDGIVSAVALDALPVPDGAVAIAGDAATEVAARLAARDRDVMLTDARLPLPRHVAMAAVRRITDGKPSRPAQPLYIDPPAVRLPSSPPRPPPG